MNTTNRRNGHAHPRPMTKPNSHDGGMMSGRTTIKTATGRFVDYNKPDPDSIDLEDIGAHLGHLCRYFGATSRFYSVAEHSLLVRDLVAWMGGGPLVQQAALFHDAAEAYIGDMVSPLKYVLRDQGVRVSSYDVTEDRITDAIVDAFSLPDLDHPMVKLADMWALYIEAGALTFDGVTDWRFEGELPNNGELPPTAGWWRADLRPASQLIFGELWTKEARVSLESAT